ncbi:hypothetical protein vseg_017779 [Gypsophila vaccaria]
MKKEDVKTVPVWVQLHQLPLKFWGKSLPKITGLIGKYIKSDSATEHRTRLGYARVMIEMGVDQKCPEVVCFKDEMGEVINIGIEYKWKPITCSKCRRMGNHQDNFTKGAPSKKTMHTKKEWRPLVREGKERTTENNEHEVAQKTPAPALQRAPQCVKEGNGGYSNHTFGALSYKEVLSPNGIGDKNNGTPLNSTYG